MGWDGMGLVDSSFGSRALGIFECFLSAAAVVIGLLRMKWNCYVDCSGSQGFLGQVGR